MYGLLSLATTACLVLIVLGAFKPHLVLPKAMNPSKGKTFAVYLPLLVLFGWLGSLTPEYVAQQKQGAIEKEKRLAEEAAQAKEKLAAAAAEDSVRKKTATGAVVKGPTPRSVPQDTGNSAGLKASAGCRGGRVVVINKGAVDWLEVKIEVNGIYAYETEVIFSGDTLTFFPNLFTTSNGERLDLSRVACKTIDLHATVGSERGHWNGGYN